MFKNKVALIGLLSLATVGVHQQTKAVIVHSALVAGATGVASQALSMNTKQTVFTAGVSTLLNAFMMYHQATQPHIFPFLSCFVPKKNVFIREWIACQATGAVAHTAAFAASAFITKTFLKT